MDITIRLFGAEADAAGERELRLQVAGESATCADLRGVVADRFPALAELLSQARFAVNHEFAKDQTVVRADDEVALIGAVSGG